MGQGARGTALPLFLLGHGAGEKPYIGIAPRHEGQLCFSGKELREPSSPSSPSSPPHPPHPLPLFPALRRLLLQVLLLRKGRPVLLASQELLGNRLWAGGKTWISRENFKKESKKRELRGPRLLFGSNWVTLEQLHNETFTGMRKSRGPMSGAAVSQRNYEALC